MPFIPVRAVVESALRISPNFKRVVFTGSELDQLYSEGPVFDLRIKLLFPDPSGQLPELDRNGDWFTDWYALPEEERGTLRTYSVRHIEKNPSTRLTVDFVLHGVEDEDSRATSASAKGTTARGATGPAGEWAAQAEPGQEILIVGPDKDFNGAGIEFHPGTAEQICLFGDETAAPAIARILEDLPATMTGNAFIEVPTSEDVLPIRSPGGVKLTWLPRDGEELGSLLDDSLRIALAAAQEPLTGNDNTDAFTDIDDSEQLIWETPEGDSADGTYYWVAGESGVVKQLRRALVRDFAIPKEQVAFMGYWKLGVAMRG